MLALFTCGGCNDPATVPLRLGESCKVQFRRDALGAAASSPISATTDGINGADTSLAGELIDADEDWLVLRVKEQHLYIARNAVLLLEYQRP